MELLASKGAGLDQELNVIMSILKAMGMVGLLHLSAQAICYVALINLVWLAITCTHYSCTVHTTVSLTNLVV